MTREDICGVYLITESVPDMLERVRIALANGVKVVQYRGKNDPEAKRLPMANRLRCLCGEYGAFFIVNDDPGLALACRADGVHLGQGDGSVMQARQMLGEAALIGVSTHSLSEAEQAQRQGADYIGFGCLFATASKRDTVSASLDELRLVRHVVSLPIVAIGGIHIGNAALAVQAGADAVAVISAVMQADDCKSTVCELDRQCRALI
ncbi:carboxythiazole phosphate tautomerase [Syntrophotalea carbinolica DSM 2380]|uniref:Thiamine-phosphate synthase n=1 Tax=Syntrophotalea carbinolica (strain DSM 2380 / NBRC 103641 / GraBd1) TaxID=338963 RepID=Q3A7P2_SYNC1|nr:thiamine phosphate synthase [Syntrophotalea carbinolica]ABA87602.1 carboxythiazole phosphate tautomerase [Syntrophotalea carbinolica DSM 2380]